MMTFSTCAATVSAAVLALLCAAALPKTGVEGAVPKTLVGGWYFIDNFTPFNGTLPAFIPDNTNYIVFSFIDPKTMYFHPNIVEAMSHFPNHIRMVSLGGQSLAGDWDFLQSADTARTAGLTAASWAKYGIDGIDIDAEDAALNQPAANMAIFMQTVKENAPNLKISLCVYGNPEGRNFDNFLINNHLNGNQTRYIDWIHIMAYNGYTQDISYIEEYTKAPKSPWDHPIDAAVAPDSVVIGMKATKGFSSCDPTDYRQMAGYVQQTSLGGVSIWAFTNANTNGTISWFDPECNAGYGTLCTQLLNLPTCGSHINPAA